MNRIVRITEEQKRMVEEKVTILADIRFPEMKTRKHRADKERNRKQWTNGFEGEFAVMNFTHSLGRPCTEPDMAVRQKGKRKHDPDLYSGNLKISVKTHMWKKNSWTFGVDYSDMVINNLSEYKNHILICVNRIDDYTFEIVNGYDIITLVREGYFAPPVKEYLRETKSCLYFNNETLQPNIQVKGLINYRSYNERKD